MFTATLWVRGPSDNEWRINAMFHRRSRDDATLRASYEAGWYQRKGYLVHIGPSQPEHDVLGVI